MKRWGKAVGTRAGGVALGVVIAAGALAGCGSDGGSSADGAPVSAAPVEKTDGPGDYRPPDDICKNIDFSALAAAVAKSSEPPKGQETGGDPTVASGAACLQPFAKSGTVDGRSIVQCTAWKNVATAVEMYESGFRAASGESKKGVTKESGLGKAAYRYENVKDSPWLADLRLVVRDSNLECEVQVQSNTMLTDPEMEAAYGAMTVTAKAVLPKLRS
ncbi:hypothetical protein OHV05_06550 [Kitasatospora sp. NBC_00070]|uniref:hypothetical protein n=1 Tax=Kitasatospora sp. NBC_00070 TaxID=2975962 RepID=UPI0032430307